MCLSLSLSLCTYMYILIGLRLHLQHFHTVHPMTEHVECARHPALAIPGPASGFFALLFADEACIVCQAQASAVLCLGHGLAMALSLTCSSTICHLNFHPHIKNLARAPISDLIDNSSEDCRFELSELSPLTKNGKSIVNVVPSLKCGVSKGIR